MQEKGYHNPKLLLIGDPNILGPLDLTGLDLSVELKDQLPATSIRQRYAAVLIDLEHHSVSLPGLLRFRSAAMAGRVILASRNISRELKVGLRGLGFRKWLPASARQDVSIDTLRNLLSIDRGRNCMLATGDADHSPARSAIESALLSGFASQTNQVVTTLFDNLQRTLSQGKGFGALLSVAACIKDFAQTRPDGALVPVELLEMLNENTEECVQIMERFSELSREAESGFLALHDVPQIVKSRIGAVKEYLAMKDQRFLSHILPGTTPGELRLSAQELGLIIDELLLNSIRFSRDHTEIVMSLKRKANSLEICTINPPALNEANWQALAADPERIFDPFYRITHAVDERFPVSDSGLGLTLVRKLVHRSRGKIFVQPGMDYSISSNPTPVLVTSIQFPVLGPLQENGLRYSGSGIMEPNRPVLPSAPPSSSRASS